MSRPDLLHRNPMGLPGIPGELLNQPPSKSSTHIASVHRPGPHLRMEELHHLVPRQPGPGQVAGAAQGLHGLRPEDNRAPAQLRRQGRQQEDFEGGEEVRSCPHCPRLRAGKYPECLERCSGIVKLLRSIFLTFGTVPCCACTFFYLLATLVKIFDNFGSLSLERRWE